MLGLARRNVARHLPEAVLAVAAVAVAAALLAAALSLRHGVPAAFDPALRAFLGGDVIFWNGEAPAPGPAVRGAGEGAGNGDATGNGGAAGGTVRPVPVPGDGSMQLAIFWPDLVPGGAYLSRDPVLPAGADGEGPPPALRDDARLASGEGYGGARWFPRLVLPARLESGGTVWLVARFPGQTDPELWRVVDGDGWPGVFERTEPGTSGMGGAGFPLSPDGGPRLHAVAPRGLESEGRGVGSGNGTGRELALEVPRLAGNPPSGPVWDWTRTERVEAEVLSSYVVPLGSSIACTVPGCPAASAGPGPRRGGAAAAGGAGVVPTWPARDVFVPWAEWRALWSEAAPGSEPQAREWLARLGDTRRARDFARDASAAGPGTALAVHDAWISATARARVVAPGAQPPAGAVLGGAIAPGGAPAGVRTAWSAAGPPHVEAPADWLAWLALLLAALLLGGQMAALVGRRQHEMGVLMALGASPAGIVALVACEALGYALAGGVAGFVLVTLATLPATSAGVTAAQWLLDAAVRFGEVLLGTLGVAGLAASAPALFAVRANVTEVIRDE